MYRLPRHRRESWEHFPALSLKRRSQCSASTLLTSTTTIMPLSRQKSRPQRTCLQHAADLTIVSVTMNQVKGFRAHEHRTIRPKVSPTLDKHHHHHQPSTPYSSWCVDHWRYLLCLRLHSRHPSVYPIQISRVQAPIWSRR